MKNINLKNYLESLAKKGLRADGRKGLLKIREISVKTGIIEKAEGSARVKMGDTDIIVGVKLRVGTPFPDTPEDGVLMTMVEQLPMASPDWEPGPPNPYAIEMARVIDRGLRESGIVDTKKLCITPGELVWIMNIDVYPLNHDGNLVDAGSIAALKAIKTATFPKLEDDKIIYEEKTNKKLPVNVEPITVTVTRLGEHLMIDTTGEEESVADTRISITVTKDNKIHAMQKAGFGSFTENELYECFNIAIKKSAEIRKKIG